MMRLVTKSLLVAGLLLVGSVPAEASGLLRSRCGGGCSAPAGDACGSSSGCGAASAPCAPAAPVAAPAPQYVERKMTRYKTVVTEREVERTVNKSVWEDQAFTYTVMVPKTYTEKRKVTENVMQTEAVAYSYNVAVPKNYTEKRSVTTNTYVNEAVAFTYSVMIP